MLHCYTHISLQHVAPHRVSEAFRELLWHLMEEAFNSLMASDGWITKALRDLLMMDSWMHGYGKRFSIMYANVSCMLTLLACLLHVCLRGIRHFRCRPYCYGKDPFGLLAHLAMAISAIWPPWRLPFRTLVMHGRSPTGIHLSSRLCTIVIDHSYTFTLHTILHHRSNSLIYT